MNHATDPKLGLSDVTLYDEHSDISFNMIFQTKTVIFTLNSETNVSPSLGEGEIYKGVQDYTTVQAQVPAHHTTTLSHIRPAESDIL